MHHEPFSLFPTFQDNVPPGYTLDFIGSRTRAEHLQCPQSTPGGLLQTPTPAIDEEYFEWIDLLNSVSQANSSYTMLELGAGYGRWAVRAYLAARRKGCDQIKIGLVEAEPAHLAWASEHMLDNNISPNDYKIYDTALSLDAKGTWFYVAMPTGSPNNSAKEWYGQCLSDSPKTTLEWKFGETNDNQQINEIELSIPKEFRRYYLGRTFALLENGWVVMHATTTPLSTILREYEFINLIDADLQGEEYSVFPEAIDEITKRVACVHIGTHNKQCESRLREVFNSAKWVQKRDYNCLQKQATPYGQVYFNDGVQTWLNPRFIDKAIP